MKHIKYKKIMTTLSLAASIGLCTTGAAMAGGPSTNVWIDVIKRPAQNRICVTVPMTYGFVVVGSPEADNTRPISLENGNLLLPNIKVDVDETSGTEGDRNYFLTFTGAEKLPIKNYSTIENVDDVGNVLNRTGLAVKLQASMDAKEGEQLIPPSDRGYWTLSDTKPGTEEAEFKKYQMSLDGKAFSVKDGDIYRMDGEIPLAAPPEVEKNGWTAAGTANIPSEYFADVDVAVGGVQGHYNKVEESMKIGTIHWTIKPVFNAEENK